MPHITVSAHTHARIGKHALSGYIDPRHFRVNPNGTVTFWVDEQVKSRLDAINPDSEAAIVRALDSLENRDTRN